MSRSQRWTSRKHIAQAVKYMDDAESSMLAGLGPYFERFPEKQIAAEAVINSIAAIKIVIEESFRDI